MSEYSFPIGNFLETRNPLDVFRPKIMGKAVRSSSAKDRYKSFIETRKHLH